MLSVEILSDPAKEASVTRLIPALVLVFGIGWGAIGAPAPTTEKQPAKKVPTPEEIGKAIRDLGSNKFVERDRASKFLWEAGAAAEAALREAALSKDDEVVSRAKKILEKFDWGLYPDTPDTVKELIEKYREGMPEQRQEAVGALMRIQPLPFKVLRKLIAKEDNAQIRLDLYARMAQQVREAVPALLIRGELDTAEELLEIALMGAPEGSGPDYANFMYLRGKVDKAIAQFEKERPQKGPLGEHSAGVLTFLYRVKGDWPAALKAARDSNSDVLIEMVLWESTDWKGLAEFKRIDVGRNVLGLDAMYYRLANMEDKHKKTIEEIVKSAEGGDEEAPYLVRNAAEALLMNGRSKQAIDLMIEKKQPLGLAFDILCAQMRHKEAFDLIDLARKRDTQPLERTEVEIRRARMLYWLGEKDSATQLFRKLVDEVKGPDKFQMARTLLKAEIRVGLSELSLEHTAVLYAEVLKDVAADRRRSVPDYLPLLEPVFGEQGKVLAATWWDLIRKESPKEDAIVTMKRIRDIQNGKLEKKELDTWIEKMVKSIDREAIKGEEERLVRARNIVLPTAAIAHAYLAAGDEAKAEEYLKKAAETSPIPILRIRYGDFLMGKKKYREAASQYEKAFEMAQKGPNALGDDLDYVVEMGSEHPFDTTLPMYLRGMALLKADDKVVGKMYVDIAQWLPLGDEDLRAYVSEELAKRGHDELSQREADLILKTGWYREYSFGNVLATQSRKAVRDKKYRLAADMSERALVGCLRTGASFIEPTAYIVVPESVRIYRARAALAEGKLDDAMSMVKSILTVMPGNVDLAIQMVPELEKAGKKKEADELFGLVKSAYTKLLKEYPNSANSHNSIAWMMVNCKRDLDEALTHATKATTLEPKAAGYLDTLAEVTFRKGNREKALEMMKKCIEMEPRNRYFNKQLARFKDQPFDSPTPDEDDDDE